MPDLLKVSNGASEVSHFHSITTHGRPVSLLSTIRNGNSDPFNTFAISVDPYVNNIVTFYRDHVLCGKHNLGPGGVSTSPTATREWVDNIEGLQDDCSAYAFLARNATILALIKPDDAISQQALTFRIQTTTLLRCRFVDAEATYSPRIISSIQMLAGAEVLGVNATGAAVHCNMLSFLFTQRAAREVFDLTLLTFALYIDIMRAATFITRPAFDVYEWLPMVFQASWDSVASSLPTPDSDPLAFMDPTISPASLRSTFQTFRRTNKAGLTFAPFAKPASKHTVNWYLSNSLIAQGRLVHYYLDMAESRHLKESASNTCMRTCLAIAALYWVRLQNMFNPSVCGVQLWEAVWTLRFHLKSAIERGDLLMNSAERLRFANASLWILYVGVHADRLQPKERYDIPKGWFDSRFARQVRSMDLLSWQEVRTVLQGFLYNDHMIPLLSSWFDDVVIADLGV